MQLLSNLSNLELNLELNLEPGTVWHLIIGLYHNSSRGHHGARLHFDPFLLQNYLLMVLFLRQHSIVTHLFYLRTLIIFILHST